MKKRLLQNSELSPIKKTALGLVIISVTYLFLAAICSVFAFLKNYAPSKYGFLSAVTFIISGAIGSFLNAKILKSRFKHTVLYSALMDALYLGIVLLINKKITGNSIMNSVCFILASILFAYFSSFSKRNTRLKPRRY